MPLAFRSCCLQVLVSAKSLDQVHAATRSFLNTVCSLCNLQTPGASPSPLRQGMRNRFDALMDVALGAAAAAGRVQAARQKLVTLQVRGVGRPGLAGAY